MAELALDPPTKIQMRFPHLQYARENHFFTNFLPVLEELKEKDDRLSDRIEAQEKEFFEFLSHSVQIDKIGSIPGVIDRVQRNLKTDVPIHMFLFEFPTATAMCMPRFQFGEGETIDELVVVVSHHFMNTLNDDERTSILGHELGHLLLGHVKIPRKTLLDTETDLSKNPDLRANVMRWAICSEVSCDIFGYVATGGNTKACSTALLKFTTGLDAKTFEALNEDALIQQVLQQYDTLSESVVDSVISSHPLTPLRLKIMSVVNHMPFLAEFGADLDITDFQRLRNQFNNGVDSVVRKIYPELFEEQELDQGFILFDLGVSIALADGDICREEVEALTKMISSDIDTAAFFQGLEETLRHRDHTSVAQELVDRAIAESGERGYEKGDALQVIKYLCIIAASDGTVDSSELLMIYRFAKHFGFTKPEVLYLANQMNAIGQA